MEYSVEKIKHYPQPDLDPPPYLYLEDGDVSYHLSSYLFSQFDNQSIIVDEV